MNAGRSAFSAGLPVPQPIPLSLIYRKKPYLQTMNLVGTSRHIEASNTICRFLGALRQPSRFFSLTAYRSWSASAGNPRSPSVWRLDMPGPPRPLSQSGIRLRCRVPSTECRDPFRKLWPTGATLGMEAAPARRGTGDDRMARGGLRRRSHRSRAVRGRVRPPARPSPSASVSSAWGARWGTAATPCRRSSRTARRGAGPRPRRRPTAGARLRARACPPPRRGRARPSGRP